MKTGILFQIREQNRQDMKTAGPQSQLLAGVITEKSPPVCHKLSQLGGVHSDSKHQKAQQHPLVARVTKYIECIIR